MIYSASSIWSLYKFNDQYHYLKYQTIFLIVGIIMMIIVSNIDYHIYLKHSNKILLLCIILLILVIIPGIGVVRNGSRSWFAIGPLSIQPSELTKLGMIIFVSKYLSRNQRDLNSIIKGVFPIILMIIFIFGLIMLEPDFGTGVVLVMTLIGIILISGVKLSFFIKIGIIGILGIIGLIIMAPYRLKRIISFLDPWQDPLGSGFQIIQSLYAIGPGGLLGQGLFSSRQKHFFLPEPQTDFIFSIISEEFGFLGVLIVTILFFIIFYRSINISIKCNDLFGKYLSFGLIFGLLFQTILNLLVVIGLIPVTGVTLPFISYGGSSLLTSMISIGLILNISRSS